MGASSSSPVHDAVADGDTQRLEAALSLPGASADANSLDAVTRQTPLHRACTAGSSEAVHLLLKAKASIDAVDRDGMTPLCYAILEGHAAAAERLVNAGASINQTGSGYSPLALASEYGHAEIVRILLNMRADVEMISDDGTSALYVASQEGHGECVQALLGGGARVRHATPEGRTPLHAACQSGAPDVVRLLLDAGAGVDTTDEVGLTPLHLCEDPRPWDADGESARACADLLMSRGATAVPRPDDPAKAWRRRRDDDGDGEPFDQGAGRRRGGDAADGAGVKRRHSRSRSRSRSRSPNIW